jgi:DNA-binding NtrC family response regulator
MEARNLDTHPHILLAEDDTELRELLMFVLARAGYRVTVCGNGMQLLEMLDNGEGVDLVISDLHMPALSGLEVLESQVLKTRRPPFICMTAFGDAKTHQTARQLGAAATIDKPFDLDRMLELVNDIYLHKDENNLSSRSYI